jgi:hypothetical protein
LIIFTPCIIADRGVRRDLWPSTIQSGQVYWCATLGGKSRNSSLAGSGAARASQVAFDQAELLADVLDAGRAALAEPGSLRREAQPDEKDATEWGQAPGGASRSTRSKACAVSAVAAHPDPQTRQHHHHHPANGTTYTTGPDKDLVLANED